jgi:hypothetical protein
MDNTLNDFAHFLKHHHKLVKLEDKLDSLVCQQDFEDAASDNFMRIEHKIRKAQHAIVKYGIMVDNFRHEYAHVLMAEHFGQPLFAN